MAFNRKKADGALYLPGEKSWEVWNVRQGAIQGPPQLLDVLPESLPLGSFMGLPLRQVHVLPYWTLITNDIEERRSMLSVQLEKAGLSSPSEEIKFHTEPLTTKENKQAFVLSFLASRLPSELCVADRYDLGVRFRPIIPGAAVLLLELGQWALVISRGSSIILAQSLVGITPKDLAGEIRTIFMGLQSMGFIEDVLPIKMLGGDAAMSSQIGVELGCSIQRNDRPSPVFPASHWPLVPAVVSARLLARQKSRLQMQVAGAVALLYLLFIIGISLNTYFQSRRVAALKSTVEADFPLVQSLRQVAARWDTVQPSVDPKRYPVELYSQVYKCLPADGVRLTLFDYNGAIQIAGEARNATLVTGFYEELKKSADLNAFQWRMVPPKILPNNSAQFQIAGGSK